MEGVRVLCWKSKKPESVSLAQDLGIKLDDFKSMVQETRTLASLTDIFRGDDIRLQFAAGPYFLDMYLAEYNIAVECDEYDHVHYDPIRETMRSKYVSATLGCKWVRYNPDAKGFSILQVANQVFCLIKQHMQENARL